MNSAINPLLLVTFFPLVGVLLILLLGSTGKNTARWIALLTSLVTFALSLWLLMQFDSTKGGIQMESTCRG